MTARIFLTDYASYNEGTQFEFGHWLDLEDFADADELLTHIKAHFEECDKKRPLYGGCKREEWMYTDFEGFPEEFYSESYIDFESLYEYLNLDEFERVAVAVIMQNGYTAKEALEKYQDVTPREFDRYGDDKYYLFEEYFPEADKIESQNPYIEIDYDRFIKDEFREFEVDGKTYLVANYEL